MMLSQLGGWLNISLVPSSPRFYSSVCVDKDTQKQKSDEKQEKPEIVHNMNVLWTWGKGYIFKFHACTKLESEFLWERRVVLNTQMSDFLTSSGDLVCYLLLGPSPFMPTSHPPDIMMNDPRPSTFPIVHFTFMKYRLKNKAWERGS